MGMVTRHLNQTAVLWPVSGADNYGNPTLGTAVEIPVRWVWVKRQITTADGSVIGIDATVQVDRAIENGSRMWLGLLSAVAGATRLCEVVAYDETPDLKGNETFREVMLMLKNNVSP